jgi:hypothetical protein
MFCNFDYFTTFPCPLLCREGILGNGVLVRLPQPLLGPPLGKGRMGYEFPLLR